MLRSVCHPPRLLSAAAIDVMRGRGSGPPQPGLGSGNACMCSHGSHELTEAAASALCAECALYSLHAWE